MSFYVVDHFIDTTIYDESIVIPSDPILPKRLTMLQAIFSSKGKANKIMSYSSPSLVKDTYGQDMDNISKYGQGGLNLVHAMSAGASAEVCRLLPHNAEIGTFLLSLQVKQRDDIPVWVRGNDNNFSLDTNGDRIPKIDPATDEQVTVAGLEFKLKASQGLTTSDVDGKITVNDTTGITTIPLYKLVYHTAGKCGSDIGHQITNDFNRDDATEDGRRYQMRFFQRDSVGSVNPYGETFFFTLNPDARIMPGASVTEALSIVYQDRDDNGREREVVCKDFISKNFEYLNALIAQYVTEGSSLDVDPINCLDKNNKPYDQFVISEDVDTTTFKDNIKFLIGGNDGSLQEGLTVKDEDGNNVVVTAEMVENTKRSLLVEFFNCTIDPQLFDERLVAADIYFDANYDWEVVKPAMMGIFRVLRPDIFVVMDIGEAPTVSSAIALVKAAYELVDGATAYTAAVIIHAGVTTDRAIPIRVTATYDYSYGLARCYAQLGTFSVFAGYQVGKVQTMRFDWYPYKDRYDTMIGPLKKLGCIYAMELERNTVWAYMSEPTMYVEKYSKLKSLRNGMVIGDAVRMAKKILIKYVFDNEGADGAIRKATDEIVATVTGRYPANITVTPLMYRSKRDVQLDTATCDLIYRFPGMIEGWTLNIRARRSLADEAAVA